MPLLDDDSYVAGTKNITLNSGGKDHVLTVRELGYAETEQIAMTAKSEGKSIVAMFVCAAVSDADGKKFEYDEIMRLKRDSYKLICESVIEMNRLGRDEKK